MGVGAPVMTDSFEVPIAQLNESESLRRWVAETGIWESSTYGDHWNHMSSLMLENTKS